MRSANKWIIEVLVVSVILLGVAQAVSWGIAQLTHGKPLNALEQILITLYLLLVGLVVEIVRWAREAVELASDHMSNIVENHLDDAAQKAIRTAVLRSIFPSGNPDQVNARIHFGIVEDYLKQVESRPALVQRASGVLARKHIAAWNDEMNELTGHRGLGLKMDESARMTAVMVENALKYMTIERSPCDPAVSWSRGFLKVIDDMGTKPLMQKKFVLLADADKLWGEQVSEEERNQARQLFLREAEYLGKRGFQIFFCDERTLSMELGTDELPATNFEVFADQIALMMDPAESYSRALPVRLRTLPDADDLRRFLQIIEEQAKHVSAHMIRTGRLS